MTVVLERSTLRGARTSFHFDLLDLEEAVQEQDASRMTHFAQRLGFDLADAFTRDAKLTANFLERSRVAVPQAETQLEHFPLAFVQPGKDVGEFFLQQRETGYLGRVLRRFVFDEVAKISVIAV